REYYLIRNQILPENEEFFPLGRSRPQQCSTPSRQDAVSSLRKCMSHKHPPRLSYSFWQPLLLPIRNLISEFSYDEVKQQKKSKDKFFALPNIIKIYLLISIGE